MYATFAQLTALIAVLLSMLCSPAAAQNVSDATAPAVSGGNFSASAVDTTNGAQSITVTLDATDDLSGVNYLYVYLRTTATSQPGSTTNVYCYVGHLESGTRTDGTFSGTCTFPQYTQSGTWFAYQVYAYDMVGNNRYYYDGGNPLTFISGTISVASPSSPSAGSSPLLLSLSMSPASVDASSAAQTIGVDAHITAPSSLSYGYAQIYDPTFRQYVNVFFYPSYRVSGSATDGVYHATLTIPRYSRTGNWRWNGAYLVDSTNAYTSYSSGTYALDHIYFNGIYQPSQSPPLLAPEHLSVTASPSDTTAPTLADFELAPSSIDVATQSATVSATVYATDDLSGFASGCVSFVSPNGQQYRTGCFSPYQPTTNIFFPQYSQAGNWSLYYLYVYDYVGNYRYYYAADLAGLGFPSSIQISSGLSVGNVSGSYGGTVALAARLTFLGSPSAGKTISFSLRGTPVGSAVTDADGVATLSGVDLGTTPAGTYVNAITASFAGDGTQAAATGSATLTVTNKLDQTITFGPLADRLLSESPITVSASASSGLPVTFTAIGNCTVSGTSVTLTAAGTCKIVASQAGDATYNAAPSVSQSFNVTAKSDQTITFAAIADRSYGSGSFTLSATASSGLAVTYQASGNCSVSGSSVTVGSVGNCQIVASQAGNASFNPAPDVTRSFAILRAALTIKADDKTKVYGAAMPAFTVTATGLVNGDTLASVGGAVSFATNPNATTASPVGSYTITPSGLTSTNYTLTFVPGTLTVTPAALTIKADDKTKVYGAPMPTFTVTATGLINGDTLASLAGAASFTTNPNATATSPAGSYSITPSGFSSTNYTLTFVAGTLSITPAALTIKADDKAKVYGAAMPEFTVTPSGLVGSDTLESLGGALTFATAPNATSASPAGTYTITPSGLKSSNYAITFSTGLLRITPANVTIKADDKTKSYGAALPSFTVTPSGLVNGDTLASLSGSLTFVTSPSTSAASPVGNYTITPGGLTSSNYSLTFAPGTLAVTPATVTIKADDKSKIYGAALPAYTVTVTGLLNGDTLAGFSGSLAFTTNPNVTAASPVGSYAITPSGLSSTNYTVTFAPGTLNVSPAAITVRADNKTKVYGAAMPGFTATVAGLVNGDTLASFSGTLAYATAPVASSSSSVGNYAIVPGGLSSPNYTVSFAPGTLSITPAPAIIKADDKSKVYGAALPLFSATPIGLVNGDTLASLGGTLTFVTNPEASAASQVGNYEIKPGGLGSPNYSLTFASGTLSITPAALRISANDAASQYSDPLTPLSVTITGFVNGDGPDAVTGSPSIATGATPTSAPGQYEITVSRGTLDAANYTLVGFDPAIYTVTREDARATYTGALFASTSSTSSGTATVTLGVTLQDISAVPADPAYDETAGDIRNATVTFVDRDAGNAALCTASIGLVSAVDTKTGVGTCSWQADIGNQNSDSFTIGLVVNGHYVENTSAEDTVVTVSRPLTSQFITGGGYLLLTDSSGELSGAPGTRTNFGFNVKYNQSGTNLQGNVNVLVRHGGRVYQIKSNSLSSLSTQLGTRNSPAATATFNGKANIRDVTDPANPVSVDGNATLQATMTDSVQSGTADTIAITVWKKSGGLWFSSKWNGTTTVQQALAGGNLIVH